MGQIGVSRKVDPEEAIDTTARRERIATREDYPSTKLNKTDFEISLKAAGARMDSRLKEDIAQSRIDGYNTRMRKMDNDYDERRNRVK